MLTVIQFFLFTALITMPNTLLPHHVLLASQKPRVAIRRCRKSESLHNNCHNSFSQACHVLMLSSLLMWFTLSPTCELGTSLEVSTINAVSSVFLRFCPCTFLHREERPSFLTDIVCVRRTHLPWFSSFLVCLTMRSCTRALPPTVPACAHPLFL